MLSRTADHLFWMARYVERAENTARLLDVNWQMSLLPQSAEQAEQGWRAMLGISELEPAYRARHGAIDVARVLDFMVRDPSNPSSIYSCLRAARENARAVRGSITTEMWETENTTWLEVQRMLSSRMLERDPSDFFEWVKLRSHLSRGVTLGTMLRDEAFHFIRIGIFLERADNTARILDHMFIGRDEPQPVAVVQPMVATHAETLGQAQGDGDGELVGRLEDGARAARLEYGEHAVPAADRAEHIEHAERSEHIEHVEHAEQVEGQGSSRDYYHWTAVLRSVSAFEVYRRVYRDVITPSRVAELLMLRDDLPRSLLASLNEVCANLDEVRNARSAETERRVGLLRAELRYGRIEDILEAGLHSYLTRFLERVNDVGSRISADFLVPLSE